MHIYVVHYGNCRWSPSITLQTEYKEVFTIESKNTLKEKYIFVLVFFFF